MAQWVEGPCYLTSLAQCLVPTCIKGKWTTASCCPLISIHDIAIRSQTHTQNKSVTLIFTQNSPKSEDQFNCPFAGGWMNKFSLLLEENYPMVRQGAKLSGNTQQFN